MLLHQYCCSTCLHAELVSTVRHEVVFAAARAEQLARCGEKEAPAEWLSQVSQPVQDVMSAMQQMASVGVQANVQKDSSHGAVMQSMTPDAPLACGKQCWGRPQVCCACCLDKSLLLVTSIVCLQQCFAN